MMGQLYRLTAASAKSRAQELLEEFDLVEAAGRPAKTYSGGMRRRLDLAVSLIATPPVLFLDEPTTGLDPRSRLAMWEIIKLRGRGVDLDPVVEPEHPQGSVTVPEDRSRPEHQRGMTWAARRRALGGWTDRQREKRR